jgi:ABC-type microcin C transport system permease subunit YejB
MKKTILTFGLISGAVISGLMTLAMVFSNQIGFDRGLLVGYTSMVLSFLLVFFGVRAYRDNEGQGAITFGRAFGLGMCIMLIACVCYVVTWEILYHFFMPDYFDKYAAHAIEQARAAGADAATLAAKAEKLRQAKAMYANPFVNAAMTFIEPFPVGLLITLISAVILRKKAKTGDAVAVSVSGRG